MKETEKPWCIYKGSNFSPIGIGKIDPQTETKNSVRVIYFDKQSQKEIWEKKYLEQFSSPEEAIQAFSKKTGGSLEKTREKFFVNFPNQ